MSEKLMIVAEMARIARPKAHSKVELRAWGRYGGRPAKLDRKALARLRKLVAVEKSRAECASILGVSSGTVGRAVA